MPKTVLAFKVNGQPYELLVEPRHTLLATLRDSMGLTGAKEGCGNGNCGSCTVLLDGQPILSCLTLALEAQGSEVTTVEGLARNGQLTPLQRAFMEYGALQCGYCTPGFLMSATALLERNPKPTEREIRAGLAGNLCRCTGYDKIVRAIQAIAKGEFS